MSRKHLDHWASICDQHTACVEFLNWLEQKGFVEEINGAPTQLADKFFEVDRQGLDRERRELLAKAASGQRTLQPQPPT